ncbi:potassium-transporting ATPase subunit C, partial [Proteus mirabilis]|uniref:potassium-transporting ATPase subunit C n=1 Tax=Proteus mirabilis TaxID=584 RepID=UPI0013D06F87
IERNGQAIGSRQIGQYFARPEYFHSRPSATSGPDPQDPSKTVDQPYNAGASAASNQGVLSKKLLTAVEESAIAYRQENGLAANAAVPVDAVTASGSGLDPHI